MADTFPACEQIVTSPPFRTWDQVHGWHELLVPIEGTYAADVEGGTRFVGGPGTAILLPAGTRHHPRIKVGDPVSFYCCMWLPTSRWNAPPPVALDDAGGHLLLLAGWMARLTRRDDDTPTRRRVKRHQARLIEAALDLAAEETGGHRDERIASVMAHLRGNPAHQHRVADLARRVGMSVSGFIKRFRTATGTTPATYLQALRLEKALALLAGTDLTTAAIADAVGYASASHLCQLIRRHTGRRASTFR